MSSPLRELTPEEFSRISRLLDQSFELTPDARNAWLTDLELRDSQAAGLLRKLFASQARSDAAGFLNQSAPIAAALGAVNSTDAALIDRRFGPYRILSLLGHGGMGSVWLAERVDGLFTRQVALKLVHPSLGPLLSKRFGREREILASLSHAHIARLFDAGVAEDGQPYLALEYVAGLPLTRYCDEHRLALAARLQLFRQVLSAVQYAHAHLVIHRDLKPSNILVTGDGDAQLLDFGIAKLLTEGSTTHETELTQLGGRALTPEYAAPEQIAGAPITTAADVYSLGVIFYELLTGMRPYRPKRDSRGALEEAILQAEPVAPSRTALSDPIAAVRATNVRKLTRALAGDLDTIALKALKKAPGERYATANAFGEDIERFLRGDVVLAQRDSFAYRAVKFAQRYRVVIAVVSVVILTLSGGLGAATYEAHVAAMQRDAALQAQLRALTQTAASRLKDADIAGAMGIILEVLPHPGAVAPSFTPEALSVFHEARATDAEVLAIAGHTGAVRFAAFSPDGRQIVTASADRSARIWDVTTGRQLLLLTGHTDRVFCAAFSPDGRRIVTASDDKSARVWDTTTGRQLLLLSGHTERVNFAAFSPDGKQIVTASFDKTARIWDAATGRQVRLLSGHQDRVWTAAFSFDGKRVVTASFDKTARIWDVATGRQLLLVSGHTDQVESAAFSPDGKRIVTASDDKSARIWDAATGRQLLLLSGHTGWVFSAAFSPDGTQIATASFDKTARTWDAATGRQLLLLSGHTDWVASAAFSPDSKRIVTASNDKTARVWDAAIGRQVLLLSGHTDQVESASFAPDGKRIVTASNDKTARIWDAATGREVLQMGGHTDSVFFAAFSPDGKRVATASYDKSARIWDATTGRQLMLLSGHTAQVPFVAFSPDGKHLVTASYDKTARIWDAATGRQLMLLRGHANSVLVANFSPDGKQIVTASWDKSARIWDAVTGRQLKLLSGHTDVVASAAFSPDGKRIVTASADKSARIWDAATGRQLLTLSGHSNAVDFAVFSPDGAQIVTASFDKTARVWDAATGRQLMLLSGHTDQVENAGFSPDGRQIATASADGSARIWQAHVLTLETQIAWAQAAQFDLLPVAERFQLGLPAATDVRQWAADRAKCDESAAAPYDPDRRASGVMLEEIATETALEDCGSPRTGAGNDARFVYQNGRTQMAGGHFGAARRDFEQALAAGHRAAAVDLGVLLSTPSAAMLDLPTAITRYEQAWNQGVTMAGFALGNLYERGVKSADDQTKYLLAPNLSLAWFWYQKAADAQEPDALGRLAERADRTTVSIEQPASRNSRLLEAFRYYAAAAERARTEDWPDGMWRNWRYRRASLARLLAREGMMQEVADAYGVVLRKYAPPSPSIWRPQAERLP